MERFGTRFTLATMLVLCMVLVPCVVSGSEKQVSSQGLLLADHQQSRLYGVGAVTVHVKEIYGTLKNHQIRPLEGALVRVQVLPFGPCLIPWDRGRTDSDGTFLICWQGFVPFPLGHETYSIVSKAGYHLFGSRSYKANPQFGFWFVNVDFTLAANGSPFL